MSGFTTTGATVVTDYEGLSRSIDMWRQFTQWLGGMGIIVSRSPCCQGSGVGGRQLMESELPGPEVASCLSGSRKPLAVFGFCMRRSPRQRH